MDTNQNFGITVQAILDANAGVSLQASLDKLTNLKLNINIDSNLKTDGIKNNLSKFSENLKETETSTGGLNNAVSSLIGNVGKVAAWGLATNAIYGTKHAMEELFSNMVEIESKLVELERVSGNLDMTKIFDGAYEASQRYGSGLFDTLDAITEIGRSYDNLDEAQIIATSSAAILASTIADMSGEDAVKTIIAVSNAYGLLIEDSELLVDKINEVDNNFSVSSQSISQALRKSASTANVFNVELDDLIGYITAISATTQESGNVIGNSLKTILSRLTTMSEAESVLDDVGISIRDMNGEIRGSSDILGELASVWKLLTDEQRQNIGVQVAGRNQLTRFLALMENFDIATKASATALTSQGSAARENAVYLQSYEAKLNKLENSQLALAKAVGDSTMNEFGKAFLDARIALTDTITSVLKFSDATTILVTSLVGLVAVLSKTVNGKKILSEITGLLTTQEQQEAAATLKNAQAQSGYQSSISKVFNALSLKNVSLKASKASLDQYTIAINNNKKSQDTLALAEKFRKRGMDGIADQLVGISKEYQASATSAGRAATAYKAAGIAAQVAGAMMQAAFTLGIGIAIGAIVNKINDLIGASKRAQEEALNSATELDNWSVSMETNKNKIIEYKKALDNSNISLEDAKNYRAELLDLQKELIEKYGQEAKGIDLVNGSLDTQIEKMNYLMQMDAQKWLNDNYNAIKKSEKALSDSVSKGGMLDTDKQLIHNAGINFNKKNTFMADWGVEQGYDVYSTRSIAGGNLFSNEDAEETIKYLNDLSTYLQKNKQAVLDAGLTNSDYKDMLQDVSSTLSTLNERYSGHISVVNEAATKTLEARDDYSLFREELVEAAKDGSLTAEEIKNLVNSHDGLEEAFEDAGVSLEELIAKYEILPDLISSVDDENVKYIRNSQILQQETEKMNANLDNVQSAFNTVSNAVKEYNETGYVTIDTLQSLLALDERYLTTLIDKNGNLQLNEQSYRNLTDAILDEAEASAINEAMTDLEVIAKQKEGTELDKVRSKYGLLQTKLSDVTLSYDNVAQAAAKYKAIEGMSAGDIDNIDKVMSSLSSKMNLINKTRTSISKSVATSMGTSAKSSNQKTYFDYVNERLQGYKDSLDSLDLELRIVQEKFKGLTEGSPEWFANLRQQENIIKRRQQTTLDYINAIQRELQSTKLSAEERVKLNNSLQQQTLEYERQNTALRDLVNTEKDYYKSQIKNKINTLKELENERHKEVIDNIKKEREAFKKAVDNQIAQIKRVEDARKFDKELEKLQAEKQTVQDQLNRLQGDSSRLANSKRLELEQKLVEIEDEILEHQIDRQNELREESLKNLQEQKNAELDMFEETENQKHELILTNLEERVEAIDELNISISELNRQMSDLANILNNFPSWSDTFNAMSGVQNLSSVFGTSPFSMTNPNNTQVGQTFVINVTANSEAEGQAAGQAIVDELMKSGLIVSGNGY